MMRSVLMAAGFAAAALSLAQPASAQDQPPDTWVTSCTMEGGKDCGVQATIDGNSLLGQFLVMRYSAAYNKISVVGDGQGVRASIQVDSNPFISTSICGQGICQFDDYKSGQLLQQLRTGRQITVQLQLQGTEAGPFTQTLRGFDAQLQRALAAQRGP
jgi:invasion protein IalB